MLTMWMEGQNQCNAPVSLMVTQHKARSFIDNLKAAEGEGSKDETFKASRGWFQRFKHHYNFHNIKMTGEAASSDTVTGEIFLPEFKSIIEEGGYSVKQVFYVDETDLFWKRIHERTHISKEEKKRAQGFKAAKDLLKLLFGVNAAGDFKLKPMLISRAANSRALKAHPPSLKHLHDNVRVIFLPPNASALMQPLEQGIIVAFKTYYLRHTMDQLLKATDGENKPPIREYWQGFNILHAIDKIGKKSQKCLATQAGFQELESEDIEDDLASHTEELINEDLQLLTEHSAAEDDDEEEPQRTLTTKRLAKAFDMIQQGMQIFINDDSNRERSSKIVRNMEETLSCYEIYKDSFFRRWKAGAAFSQQAASKKEQTEQQEEPPARSQ
ncbi:tigger transposable element-derived protein 1-like [Homarus americanus]|uniref:tigger transposable element-derived protein 1-like n=1 Tax=Homarus americanus TaxID=6706 RepID=UPI001C448DD5|nr:tigger transposable element-derived protein 1-like [Homarus americanus]